MEFALVVAKEQALAACSTAVADRGLRSTRRDADGLLCDEPPAGPFAFTNPASVQLTLSVGGPSATLMTLHGSNTGFGPIQFGHVKKQPASLRDAILRRAPGA
jgi:hypothetical protein